VAGQELVDVEVHSEYFARNGSISVQHNTDALHPRRWSLRASYRLLRETLPLFDLYFTSNLADYAALAKAVSAHRADVPGLRSPALNATPLAPEATVKWASDLVFVGHHEARTERGIPRAARRGPESGRLWAGWERSKNRSRLAGGCVSRAWRRRYELALKGAKIGLCLFGVGQQQTAGRSFEIPASGHVLLAQRTREHGECYQEGEEAEFFGDEREFGREGPLLSGPANEPHRLEIARRGHEALYPLGLSWARYMRDDWAKTCARLAVSRSSARADWLMPADPW